MHGSARTLLAIAACLLLGWPAPAPVQAAPSAGPDARAVRATTLRWRDCEGSMLRGARCARLSVPLDWSHADGPRVSLALARYRATGAPSERIGTLVFNAGGPGAAGLPRLRELFAGLPRSVRDRFDMVAWDPRGVGQSSPRPRECPRAAVTPPPVTGPVDWAALARGQFQGNASAMTECLRANADIAGFLGTPSVVRDLDAIRAALGERRITFWGMSYGTTIGRVFAQQHPDRLRALVLDGNVDPSLTNAASGREQVTAVPRSWERFAATLTPRLRGRLGRVMAELEVRPIVDADGRVVSRWDIASSLNGQIPSQAQWADARLLIRASASALFDPVRAMRDDSARRLADAFADEQSGTFDPLLRFVDCSDMPDRPTEDEVVAVTQQAAATGGLAAAIAALDEAAKCAGLPADIGTPLPAPEQVRLRRAPLVVNALADPRTPAASARAMARVFPGARLVSYDSTQHVLWQRTDSACVNDRVTRYVLTRRLPRASIDCPLAGPR